MNQMDLNDEIDKVASNAARKEAIELFAEGRLSEGLKRVGSPPDAIHFDKFEESRAMWIDDDLYLKVSGVFHERWKRTSSPEWNIFGKPNELIELWGASPLEIALRKGTIESFAKVLDEVSSPRTRFERAGYGLGKGWTSPKFREKHYGHSFLDKSEWFEDLILLAVLVGKTEAAELMLRKGWHRLTEAKAIADAENILRCKDENPQEAAAWLLVDEGTFPESVRWLTAKGDMERRMEEIFESTRRKETLRRKVDDLLAENPPVGYFSIAVATQKNETELLKKLFGQGGNPNCVNGYGEPLLSEISEKVSPEALRIWLDYGANPQLGADANVRFGTALHPSPIRTWVEEGRLDLVRVATEESIHPIELFHELERKTYSPLLALALENGHADMALWMIKNRGCSLDHFVEYDSDRTCGSHASPKTLSKVQAALMLSKQSRDSSDKPRPRGRAL